MLPTHLDGPFTSHKSQTSLGGSIDGTLRSAGIFSESGLVHMPKTLTFREASTLPCAALTAWNALMGLPGRPLRRGDYVLTLGSGGVSLFALQIAVASGATVISTTSSAEKAERLRALGAHHVINYKADPNWDQTARQLTPDGAGFDFVIEVGGVNTLKQSLAATKMEGVMAIVGIVGGVDAEETRKLPSLLDAWLSTIIVRGIAVGSRAQFVGMNAFVEASGLKPVVDEREFGLREVKDAYEFLEGQGNFGKVVVDCQRLAMA
jgi:NADPH:quinone reductase-like Zn-dependent oxidoreductase